MNDSRSIPDDDHQLTARQPALSITTSRGPSETVLVRYHVDLATVRKINYPHVTALNWAWWDFLRPHPWRLIVTATYSRSVHPERARKQWIAFINALNRHRSRRSRLPIVWCRADECQKRGALHHHALLGCVEGITPVHAARLWASITGGNAHVRVYDKRRGGILYVIKEHDIELSGPWWPQS